MGLLGYLRKALTTTKVVRQLVRPDLVARYEAIDDDAENANHWITAKSSWPNGVTPYQRQKLRNKARHERENNGSLDGLIQQYGGDFIGTGPRLQLQDSESTLDKPIPLGAGQSNDWTDGVERLFGQWARVVNLAEKLTILVETEPLDGESFLQMLENPALESPIKLDLRNIEAEQVATPLLNAWLDPIKIDGLVQDEYGNVVAYEVLKYHPGNWLQFNMEFNTVPAETMCHWFRPQRGGQGRGASAFAPTVETCASIRRYAKATLGKQELAAHMAVTIEIDAPPQEGEPAEFKLMDKIPIPRNAMLTTPKGSNAKVFETAQNTTGYGEYVDSEMTKVGRPLLAARNLVTGDSSNFNFASGKMDHLPWQASTYRKRERLRHRVLDKIMKAFYAFALTAGELPDGTPPFAEWVYDFHYDGFLPLDPVKEITALEAELRLGVTTLAIAAADRGYDWRELAYQRSTERKLYLELGLDPDLGMIANPKLPPAKPDGADSNVDPALEDTALDDPPPAKKPVKGALYV